MIVTDYNDDDMRRAAHEAGARQYIVKENLLDIVDFLAKADNPLGKLFSPAASGDTSE